MTSKTSATSATHRTYSFGEFTLDVDRGALLSAGVDIKLRPKSFEVLTYLVERYGRLVSKNELLDAIWSETVVTDDAVTQCLVDIRRAIKDQSQKVVRTVPRRGYIIDIPVTEHGGMVTAPDTPPRGTFASGLSRWRLGAALVVILGVAVVWWGFASIGVEVPESVEPQPAAKPPSIAVLPFLDMSPLQDQGYVADWISE
jgi:DNA-binding winged helix-turn-helix (wHTH) protein